MTPIADPTRYSEQVKSTLHRLVAALQDAVDEGGFGAAECAQLHTWIRAELLPWAADASNRMNSAQRRHAGPLFVELAELDAAVLGTVGERAAALAQRVLRCGDGLVEAVDAAISQSDFTRSAH